MSVTKGIEFHHSDRGDKAGRLDLLTNDMVGITAFVDGNVVNVCDISQRGFSYAHIIPAERFGNLQLCKAALEKKASSLIGTKKNFLLFFKGKNSGGMKLEGTVKNHRFLLGFSSREIRKELHNYVNNLVPNPQALLNKEQLKEKIKLLFDAAEYQMTSQFKVNIAMNATFVNFVQMAGGNIQDIEAIYKKYADQKRTIFLHYGVQLEETFGNRLLRFARSGNIDSLQKEEVKEDKNPYILKINKAVNITDFVQVCWRNCLNEFKLDSGLEILKEELINIRERLTYEGYNQFDLKIIGDKEFEYELVKYRFNIEKLADPAYKGSGKSKLESCFVQSIHKHLQEKNESFDDSSIEEKIEDEFKRTFYLYLKRFGWGKEEQ